MATETSSNSLLPQPLPLSASSGAVQDESRPFGRADNWPLLSETWTWGCKTSLPESPTLRLEMLSHLWKKDRIVRWECLPLSFFFPIMVLPVPSFPFIALTAIKDLPVTSTDLPKCWLTLWKWHCSMEGSLSCSDTIQFRLSSAASLPSLPAEFSVDEAFASCLLKSIGTWLFSSKGTGYNTEAQNVSR